MSKKKKTKKQRLMEVLIPLIILCAIAIFYILHVAFVMNQTNVSVVDAMSAGGKHMITAPFALKPFPTQALLYIALIAVLIFVIVIYAINDMKKRKHDDLKTIAGAAKWLDEKELAEYNEHFTEPIGEPYSEGLKNMILSQEMCLSMDVSKTNRNLNVLCIGGSGTGKSFREIGPNLLQRNCSMVVTTPAGDLYRQYGSYLEHYGYKVKCFNVEQMDLSNRYNPFKYIHSDKDVMLLVTMLIENTTSPQAKKGDDFWEKGERALLCALIAYLYHYRPEHERTFAHVQSLLRTGNIDENNSSSESKLDEIFTRLEKDHPNCFAVDQYNTFRLGAGKTLKSFLVSCAIRLQAFDLDDVKRLTNTDDIELDKIGDEKTAIFIVIPTGDETFNFLAGLMYSQLFTSLYRYCESEVFYGSLYVDAEGEVVKTFRAKNVNEKAMAKKAAEDFAELIKEARIQENAYGLWEIKAKDTVIAFRGTEELANEALKNIRKGKIKEAEGKHCPIHVMFYLDEFPNTGKIPNFVQKISTMRKYWISVFIILQSLTQLQNMYPKEWSTITGNCDTTVYLGGGNDVETTRWLKTLFDKRTVKTMSQGMSRQSSNENYSLTGQDLYSMSQLRTMPETDCIVLARSQNPYMGKMYDTLNHPEWSLRSSLPEYEFIRDKSFYIKEVGMVPNEKIKKEEKNITVPKETPEDKAYRENENEKERLRAGEMETGIDPETGEAIATNIAESSPEKTDPEAAEAIEKFLEDAEEDIRDELSIPLDDFDIIFDATTGGRS